MLAATIDLETLDTRPHSVILSLGAVLFDPDSLKPPHRSLSLTLDVDQQLALGRTVSDSTLEWWSRQNSQAQQQAFSDTGRVSLDDALDQLNRFLVGVDQIWAQGPVFDIVMLENLMTQLARPAPWHYWQIRDSRTIFEFLGLDPRRDLTESGEITHCAVDDARVQSIAVQICRARLRELGLFD
jgi:hypothetical protein